MKQLQLGASDTSVMSSRMWIATGLFALAMSLSVIALFIILGVAASDEVRIGLLCLLALTYAGGLYGAWRLSAWIDERRDDIAMRLSPSGLLLRLRAKSTIRSA